MYLTPNGGADALNAAVAAVSDPSSAQYRQFLTTAQYDATYAPTQARSTGQRLPLGRGPAVTGVEAHHRYVEAATDEASSAIGLRHPARHVHPRRPDGYRPEAAAAVPTGIAGNVLTVTGLDTTSYTKTANRISPADQKGAAKGATNPNVTPPTGFVNARPCSTYYGQVPRQLPGRLQDAAAEVQGQDAPVRALRLPPAAVPGGLRGHADPHRRGRDRGHHRCLRGADDRLGREQYAERHGDGLAAGQFAQRLAGRLHAARAQCDPSGWYGEETLDVEAVHAMAPGANSSTTPRRAASTTTSSTPWPSRRRQRGAIVTNSWGDLEEPTSRPTNVAAYEQVFQQAALQGIAFLFSSGDNGDELANSGIRQADYPASDPYITAAGGTSTGIDANGALAQTGWGTDKYSLSANGSVDLGRLPLRRRRRLLEPVQPPELPEGVVRPRSDAARAPCRTSRWTPTRRRACSSARPSVPGRPRYGEYRIGGTSLASPLMAGFASLGCRRTAPASACSTRCSTRRRTGRSPTSGRRRTSAWSGSTTRTGSTVPPGCSTRSVRSTRTLADDDEGLGHGHRTRCAEPEAARRHPVGSLTTL